MTNRAPPHPSGSAEHAQSHATTAAAIRDFLALFWQPDDTREVRIPKWNRYRHTAAGWFDDPDTLARAAARYDGKANIYLTLNPCSPDLLGRSNNAIRDRQDSTTADTNIERRRLLLIDIDAVRIAGISSTDTELAAARAVLEAVRTALCEQGWPEPITAMSGNGWYLLFAVDLPNDEMGTELVRRLLEALAAKFNTAAAHIDTSVHNAGRIVGLVGTLKVKGDPLPQRPHRRSYVESAPAYLVAVTGAQLEAVACEAATAPNTRAGQSRISGEPGPRLADLLQRAGIAYSEQPADANGVTWYHVERCPFHTDGPDYECGVGQELPKGKLAGHCFHNRGAGKGWPEFKEALGLSPYFGGVAQRNGLPPVGDGSLLDTEEKPHLSDLGNAHRLVKLYGDDLRFNSTAGGFFTWDGRRYQRDEDDARVIQFAAATARSIYSEATAEEDPDRRQALGKHALKSEAAPRLTAIVALAKTHPTVRVQADAFDADRSLLNCPNGALNTITGELHAPRRTDLCTKLTGAPYDPGAICPTWDAFLARIMGGNEALIGFLQRAIGYSLTGDTGEQVLFLLHGKGANGKSTLLEVIRALLGDYAKATPFSTFLSHEHGERATNDLAALAGARFVAAIEADAGKRLSESVIKQVTGGDPVTARFLFREFFEYVPMFKLWLAANVKPTIQGTDEAIWRRVRLIPFSVTIPEPERDRHLAEKLRSELPGILAWAVRGCLEWRHAGLDVPEEVRQATAEYRTEQDTLATFFDEACVLHGQAIVSSHRLYNEYMSWCANTGEKPVTQRALANLLTERGYKTALTGKDRKRMWSGIGLLTDIEPPPGGDRSEAGDRSAGQNGEPSATSPSQGEIHHLSDRCDLRSPPAVLLEEVPCYWCKRPAPVGAQYGERWVCLDCQGRELPSFAEEMEENA